MWSRCVCVCLHSLRVIQNVTSLIIRLTDGPPNASRSMFMILTSERPTHTNTKYTKAKIMRKKVSQLDFESVPREVWQCQSPRETHHKTTWGPFSGCSWLWCMWSWCVSALCGYSGPHCMLPDRRALWIVIDNRMVAHTPR
jgi:hypothetical protein